MPHSPSDLHLRHASQNASGLEHAITCVDRALENSRPTHTGEIFITTTVLQDTTIIPEIIRAYEAAGWRVRHENDREGPVLIFKPKR